MTHVLFVSFCGIIFTPGYDIWPFFRGNSHNSPDEIKPIFRQTRHRGWIGPRQLHQLVMGVEFKIRCIWIEIFEIVPKQNWYLHVFTLLPAQHTFQILPDPSSLAYQDPQWSSPWVRNCAPFSAFLMSPSAAKIKASKPDWSYLASFVENQREISRNSRNQRFPENLGDTSWIILEPDWGSHWGVSSGCQKIDDSSRHASRRTVQFPFPGPA